MGIFLIIIFLPIVLSAPAWIYLKKRKAIYWWDYGISIYAQGVWLIISLFGIGAQSLTNGFLEPILAGFFAIAINYIHLLLYIFFKKQNKIISFVCIILTIIFAVALLLYMPVMSE